MSFSIPKSIYRPAFTMIELILVIVILGIVSSIGAEIIANVYEGYIIQRAQHRASIKTELAATQIANRLAYAIPGTVVRKNGTAIGGTDINEPGNANDTTLQWVGADMDSFNAMAVPAGGVDLLPGWSGFCDLDALATSNSNIVTPGSNLNLANTIRTNLDINANSPHVYFPTKNGLLDGGIINISLQNNTFTLPVNSPKIVEHYKIASTSYALVADGDLTLYYNFNAARAVAVGGTSQILLRNVSTFEFTGSGRTIRFKICVDEPIGDENITICKEKAVF